MKYMNIGKDILKRLKSHGHEAYFVGGFVRDKMLDIISNDIDITTSATPEEVTDLFDFVKNTGAKFGTVTIIIDSFRFEVTTFRSEGRYINNRKPSEVTFSTDVKDDLKRRDFTMNAIIMDEDENYSDYFNGIEDINNRIIKTINDPSERFLEDALRMLRAFRFSSKLGFDIEANTLNALKENKTLIKNISIERIMVELEKIFKGAFKNKALKYMVETDFHKELFGLDKGIEYLSEFIGEVTPIEAFIVSFVLNDFEDVWRFSNKNMRLIHAVLNLHEVTKDLEFNKYIMFSNGLDSCLLSNRISVILGYKDQEEDIRRINDSLIVKDVCDLKFKGQDILALTTLKKRSIIALVIDDLLYNVIMEILPNEYGVLKEFALKRVEELQKDLER